MLSDYFSPKVRATALAVYSSGIYIGAGIGTFLGGMILDTWNGAYPDITTAPFGLKAWQAAFFAVGIPGILMALWVRTLKEPTRGMSEGLNTPAHPHPFKASFEELMAILPPLTLFSLWRAGGIKLISWNLLFLASIGAISFQLIEITGNTAQWIALGVGVYAATSWVQDIRLRDHPTFVMIFKCRTMICLCWGIPFIAFITYGIGFWSAPFMIRVHGLSASEVGIFLGLGAALGGGIGVTLGGIVSDLLRRRYVNGRLMVIAAVPILSVPIVIVFLTTENPTTAYIGAFFFSLVAPMWIGPAAGTLNDLVLPRMRALASAFYIMMITFIGLALGPYLIGYVSDVIASTGVDPANALRQAMIYSLFTFVIAGIAIVMALRFLPTDEATRLERAKTAGEPGLD